VNLGIGRAGLRVGGGGLTGVDLGLAMVVRRPYRRQDEEVRGRPEGGRGWKRAGRQGGTGAADRGWRWHAIHLTVETGIAMQIDGPADQADSRQ
jgi:hypothetical protein